MAIDWKGKLVKLVDFGSEATEIRYQRTILMAALAVLVLILIYKRR